MKPIKEIIDFINSYKKNMVVNLRNNNTSFSDFKITKQTINDYTLLFYTYSKNLDNKFLNSTTNPLFLLDKNNEIIYAPDYRYVAPDILGYFIDGCDTPEIRRELLDKVIKDSATLRNKIKKEIYGVLQQELSILDKQILETLNLDDFKKDAILKYKNKVEIEFPIKENDIMISPDAIIAYLNDKTKLKDVILDCISDSTLQQYEKYVAENKCIEDYVKEIEENPSLIIQNAIKNVIEGDKQSYTITYHDQNGSVFKDIFKKSTSKMRGLITQIFDYNLLNGIPIELIDTISWRNNVLYDAKNFSTPEITEKETAIRLYSLNKSSLVASKYKTDKEILKVAVLENPHYYFIPPEFEKDGDFILEIMKEITKTKSTLEEIVDPTLYPYERNVAQNKTYIFEHTPSSLTDDKTFLTRYLELLSGNGFEDIYHGSTTYKTKILNSISKHIKSYEFAKLCIKSIGIQSDLINLIPEEFLNKKEMLEFIKNIAIDKKIDANRLSMALFSHISNIENLEYMFDNDMIKAKMYDLHNDIITNRNFILKNMSDSVMINNRIFLQYKDDKEVIDKIIGSAAVYQTKPIFDLLGIKPTDSVKKFEMCGKNIVFIARLTKNEASTFIDGELSDIENISVHDNTISILTSNCKFDISTDNISIKNNNSSQVYFMRVYDSFYSDLVYTLNKILHDKYKLRSSKFDSSIAEILKQHNDISEER